MLNKEICLHCYLHSISLDDDRKGDKEDLEQSDRRIFENRWKNNWVHCLPITMCNKVGRMAWAKIFNSPPNRCAYLLEQVVEDA
jgi:hypothetical protein